MSRMISAISVLVLGTGVGVPARHQDHAGEPNRRRDFVLTTLRNVVANLPSDVRLMLLEARLDERQLTLRGQTAQHRDAERITEAVNRVPAV